MPGFLTFEIVFLLMFVLAVLGCWGGLTLRYKPASDSDPLTGLLSQEGFHTAINSLKERARGEDQSLAFLLLDVDNFKRLCEMYGDGVGNDVLKGCLLYTSPSPRDQRGARMPSSA